MNGQLLSTLDHRYQIANPNQVRDFPVHIAQRDTAVFIVVGAYALFCKKDTEIPLISVYRGRPDTSVRVDTAKNEISSAQLCQKFVQIGAEERTVSFLDDGYVGRTP